MELDGFPAVYAMCAIDALGIPAMAGRDGRIVAVDPRDGTLVAVSVRDGRWRWAPAGAVVVLARTADCGNDCASWEVMCPHTTFHASRDSAQAYLAARPGIEGKILDQQAAVESGRRGFRPLLGGPALRASPGCSQALSFAPSGGAVDGRCRARGGEGAAVVRAALVLGPGG